jgi:hypothetical protein
MSTDQLRAILDAHAEWLADDGGERADLSGADLREANLSGADLRRADLSGADLREADLREANLSGADLRRADLREADLSGADLRRADLSGAEGLLDPVEWIAANFRRTRGGIIAYKTFDRYYAPPDKWVIEPGAEIAEVVNPLPTCDCGCGVNVATREWCRDGSTGSPVWEVLIKWEWMIGAVVPYNTDGKFRVPRASLIRELP